ncbi:MAG: 30S ribosomal protein S20, partial [Actinobacteria bacterium]|nr:30S ribosomal protein S20 [Actinomycetota bacterium]
MATSALMASRPWTGVSGASELSKLRLSRYSRRPPVAETSSVGHIDMANIASQKKRILRSERERTENRLLTSTVKTYFRRLETAVES